MKQIPLAIGARAARAPSRTSAPAPTRAALAHLRGAGARRAAGLPVGPGGQRQDAPAARRASSAARAGRPASAGSMRRRPPRRGASTSAGRWSCIDDAHALDARAAAGRLRAVRRGDDARRGDRRRRAACRRSTCRCARTCAPASAGATCSRSQPLAEAEVRAALRREADRRGVFLSDDVMDYLLTRFARDLKHLMAQLDRARRVLARDQARDHRAAAASRCSPRTGVRDAADLCAVRPRPHAAADRLRPRLGRVHGRASAGSTRRRSRAATTPSTPHYKAGTLDIARLRRLRHRAAARARRRPSAAPRTQRFMREVIAPALRPAGAGAGAQRTRSAATCSPSSPRPTTSSPRRSPRAFGVDDADRRPARARRRRLRSPAASTACRRYREGKVARVGQWLAARGAGWADFERISVYSDSLNDLPLLERATDPVATNPVAGARGRRARARLAHPETVRNDQEIHRQAARQAGTTPARGRAARQARRGAEDRARHRPGAGRRARRQGRLDADRRRLRGLHRRRRGARPAARPAARRTSTSPPTPRPSRSRALFRRAFIIGRRFRIVHVVFGRGRQDRGLSEVIEVSTFRAYSTPPPPSRSSRQREDLAQRAGRQEPRRRRRGPRAARQRLGPADRGRGAARLHRQRDVLRPGDARSSSTTTAASRTRRRSCCA